jgi:hypothetical protein
MPYKFKRTFSSLSTGATYTAGMLVPDAILIRPAVVIELTASGDIEEEIAIAEVVEEEKVKDKKKKKDKPP